jgi:hypothetical protein
MVIKHLSIRSGNLWPVEFSDLNVNGFTYFGGNYTKA